MNRLTDTTPEADVLIIQLLRQTPIWRKLQMMEQLNAMTRALALSGLRQRYPQATPEELRRLLADRLLGVELAAEAYGSACRLKQLLPHCPSRRFWMLCRLRTALLI